MQLDPVLLATTSILATVGDFYLTAHPSYSANQRRWAEWAVWGLLSLACRLQLRRRGVDDTNYNDKEAQGESGSKLTEHSSTLLAILLVSSQYVALYVGRTGSQFIFPLIPLAALLFKTAWQNPSTGQASSWRGRLSQQFDSDWALLLFLAGSVFSPPWLLYQTTGLNSITILMNVFLATGTAYSLVTIGHQTDSSEEYQLLVASQHLKFTQSVSWKAFVFCTVYLAVFSVKIPTFFGMLAGTLVILRLLGLVAVFALCFNHASISASALLTPAATIASSLLSQSHSSKGQFLVQAAASITILDTTLPKSSANKRLYLFLVVPLLGWLATSYNSSTYGIDSLGSEHPIRRLVDTNERYFENMLSQQSATLSQAVREYKRRYGRSPPPGFDRWFEIAQSKDFRLIDEFDVIMETLEPFWGLSPTALRERIKSVELQDAMIGIQVNSSGLTYSVEHHYAATLKQWTEPDVWGDILPDVKFVISAFDEPRVVAPYDTIERAMAFARKDILVDDGQLAEDYLTTRNEIKWINIGKQGIFEGVVASCHITSPARRGKAAPITPGQLPQLPFVSNITSAMDVCASPDLLHGHGLLAAPDTMILTHSLVPIFSQCKPSVFSDVLYPSPYYGIDYEYDDSQDLEWDDKGDQVYWAGSSTGGHNTIDNWEHLHRSRLTLATEAGSIYPTQILERDVHNNWQPRNTTYGELADLFHLRITRVVQCEEDACEKMKEKFIVGDEPSNAALGSKYALDIDGNAYSGRYYKLLKSNSAVMKHTSFKEWHDGRLQPWVHFIPLSASADELAEVSRFLLMEDEGLEIGKKIAEQGKEWARKTLRPIDLEVVFIRVLLEYARIMSDDRDQLGFGM